MREMLASLMQNFLIEPSNPDPMNSSQMQLVVKECIARVVQSSTKIEDVTANQSELCTVFNELIKDASAIEYVTHLFKELLSKKFTMD